MYFGICNLPITFQLIMDSLFHKLIIEGKIVVYMDNILIFSKTMEEYKNIVKEILQILANNKLLLYSKKCQFHQTKIDYLGIIISQDSVETSPTKVKGVADWPEPQNQKEVQQFLGFCNFYWRFIKGFAQIARQLTELTEKKKWLEEERGAFEKLKKRMMNIPTLAIPKPNKEFRMKVDASGYAVGGVLSQQQENKSWKPIAYLLRSMNKTERNYEIYDQELLVIITGLKQ